MPWVEGQVNPVEGEPTFLAMSDPSSRKRAALVAAAVFPLLAAGVVAFRHDLQDAVAGTALDAPLRLLRQHARTLVRPSLRCPREPLRPDAPPLILVAVDTLRADRLGFHGRTDRTVSPHLDALSRDSWTFENAIAPAPWTTPSFAAVMTGVPPLVLGIGAEPVPIPREARTLGERLCAAGYRTAGVVSHTFVGSAFGFDRGFERWDETDAGGHTHVSSPGVTAAALRHLESFASNGGPFFLFVHYFDPHYDYRDHPGFPFGEGTAEAGDDTGMRSERDNIRELRRLSEEGRLDAAAYRRLRDSYDSEVAFTDAAIGRLLDRARELGVYDDALVVFVADHGELFGERPDRWIGHTVTVHQGAIHVPLLVKPPARAPEALRRPRRVKVPVTTADVGATALELLGFTRGVSADDPPLPGHSARGRGDEHGRGALRVHAGRGIRVFRRSEAGQAGAGAGRGLYPGGQGSVRGTGSGAVNARTADIRRRAAGLRGRLSRPPSRKRAVRRAQG